MANPVWTFSVVVFLATGSFAATAVNPDLEQLDELGRPVGWTLIGDHFKADRGEGRNGTVGLRCDCDGKDVGWFVQYPEFEAGKDYRFECWVRTENLKGTTGVRLSVSWRDGNDEWLGDAQGVDVVGTTEGWRKIAVDAVLPRKAAKVSIGPRIGKDATGTVWLDDFSFGPLNKPPIRYLASDAYRNTATGGRVTFRLVSNATDDEIAKRGWKGTIRLPGEVRVSGGGGMAEVSAPAFTNGTCTFSVDVSAMPFGEFPVSFALDDPKGVRVGTATLMFTRVREWPKRKVWIDAQGRTVVNGRLFFPLGMYTSAVSAPDIDRLSKGPFNCVMNYRMPSRAELDDIQAHGLMSIYSLKDLYRGQSKLPVKMTDDEDERAYVAARVASLRNHPAILAWYINDELGPEMTTRLADRANLIARLDPDHPTWSVLYQVDHMRSYMLTSDVLGTDPYPIGLSDVRIGRVAESTRMAREALFGARPLWQVPQDFDWAAFRPSVKDTARAPTERELRNMCWQCIAEGANGLVLYKYDGYTKLKEKYSQDERWAITCRVAGEIRDRIPMLLADPSDACVSGLHPDVSIRAWRMDDGIRVLAVNTMEESRRISIRVAGKSIDANVPALGVFIFTCGEEDFRLLEAL